jgi:hypothetical protein
MGNYPRKMKTCVYKRNMYMFIHSNFIHNSPKLETTQMSFKGWLQQPQIFSNKKNKLLIHNLDNLHGVMLS